MSEDEITLFEKRWRELLDQALNPLFLASKNHEKIFFDKNKYTRLYTIAYDMSTTKSSNIQIKCYDRICELVTNYCQDVSNFISTILLENPMLILERFVKEWIIYKENILHWIFKIFSYILKNHHKVRKQKNLDIELKSIFKNSVFQDRNELLEDAFINLMNIERNGKIIDTNILKNYFDFLNMSENFSLEERNIFKIRNKILNFLCANYSKNSDLQFKSNINNYLSYLNWGNASILTETKNLSNYLPLEISQNLVSEIKEIIFYNRYEELMDSSQGVNFLLENFNIEFLKLSFSIFKENKDSTQKFLEIFKKFSKISFEKIGSKIDICLPDSDIPFDIAYKTNYIDEIFSVFEKIHNLIIEAFETNNSFISVLKEVFSDSQSNNQKYNCSYILPFSVDLFIKKLSLSQFSEKDKFYKFIDRLIFFFPTLPEKDSFIDIHKNLLCERLLNDLIVNYDFEEYILEKLKAICGLNYVNTIEGIITDTKSQASMNSNYFIWLKENPEEMNTIKLQTNFQILDANVWPKFPIKELNLPEILLKNSDRFNRFYKQSNEGKGRCFKWIHNYSFVEIETNLNKLTHGNNLSKNPLILIANNFQTSILNLFNKIKSETIHLFEISKILNLNEDDLKESILPMVFGNGTNILEKVNRNIDIEDSVLVSDAICLNKNFNTENSQINLTNFKKSEGYIKKEKIAGERSSAIEANIVKIMKHYKTLNHHDLVEKVLKCLEMFKINISSIKKKIDNLIERDIIRRDKDNPHVYNYFNDTDN